MKLLALADDLPQLPPGPQSATQLMAIIDVLTNWIFAGFAALAVVMVLLAALQFLREGANPEKVSEARQKLIWATIGIGVALMAKGFVPVMQNILGA